MMNSESTREFWLIPTQSKPETETTGPRELKMTGILLVLSGLTYLLDFLGQCCSWSSVVNQRGIDGYSYREEDVNKGDVLLFSTCGWSCHPLSGEERRKQILG